MSYTVVRTKKEPGTPIPFWLKVERIFGDIPSLIRLILEFNGFDSLLALKGIRWDDKKYFFETLEESVTALAELDDSDPLKEKFIDELSVNHQKFENFKLKLGHKNLIINLCHELQTTNIEEFNGRVITLPEPKRMHSELIVRKQVSPEEHGYSKETKKLKLEGGPQIVAVHSQTDSQEVPSSEQGDSVQFAYEVEEEEEDQQFIEQEFLEDMETYDEETEIVEYQEVHPEDIEDDNGIYLTEQIIKCEAANSSNYEEADCFEMTGYESSSSQNRSGSKHKKPLHMYSDEYLQTQITAGRIGTPGRRRPKILKHYPDTEAGLLARWSDLVRQSCEVIVPSDLLARHDLSHIELVKIHDNIWEVKCPMCTKKLRLQLTHEGKYTNYKRSNFERHLRIVHYKQIVHYKPDHIADDHDMFEEIKIKS